MFEEDDDNDLMYRSTYFLIRLMFLNITLNTLYFHVKETNYFVSKSCLK